jgi:anti-sigma factor RsiW
MMDTARHHPCPDREYQLVDMIDGSLPPDEARQLQAHLDGCPRCRDWLAGYREVDLDLQAALPRAALSPGFEQRLAARIAATGTKTERSAMLGRARFEHDQLLQGLKSSTRRTLVLNAVGTLFTVVALWLLAGRLAERFPLLLPGLAPDERHIALGMLGSVLALATLAWSAARGFAPRFTPRG